MHLSIAVPAPCPNNCPFCIAKMQKESYKTTGEWWGTPGGLAQAKKEYVSRMAYAKDVGCTSLTLTGEGEPLMSMGILALMSDCNDDLRNPFQHITLQTSGATLTCGALKFLKETTGITGINLSICHPDSVMNAQYTRPRRSDYCVDIPALCREIRDSGFTLRLCINLTDLLDGFTAEDLLLEAEVLGAHQVTFRALYNDRSGSLTSEWITRHSREDRAASLANYCRTFGTELPSLSGSISHYSVGGMSVAVDYDCMSELDPKEIRSLIIREDQKLYTRWNDRGSIVF